MYKPALPIILSVAFGISSSCLAAPVIPTPRVTISLQGNHWIARRDSKVLWSYPAYKGFGITSARNAGFTVVSINDENTHSLFPFFLLVSDATGTIRAKLPLSAEPDPKVLLVNRRYVVYESGVKAPWHIETRAEGTQLWRWLNENRSIRVYDLRGYNRLVWNKPEPFIGLPLALRGEQTLETLCIVNAQECLENNRVQYRDGAGNPLTKSKPHYSVKPRIDVVERDIATGKVHRRARLRLTRTEANAIFAKWLGTEPLPVQQLPRIVWGNQRVSVRNLFGHDYQGQQGEARGRQ